MKRCYYVLFLCLFVFIAFGSCSFASFSASTQQDIISKVNILKDKGLISDSVLNSVANNVGSSSFSGSSDNYFIFIGNGTRYNGGSNGRIQKMVTSSCLYLVQVIGSSVSNFTNDSTNMLYTLWNNSSNGLRVYLNNGSYGWGNYAFNDALDGFYCYTSVPINTRLLTLGAGEEVGGSYLVYNGPEFVPIDSKNINVYYNGSLVDVSKRLDFGYVFPKTSELGHITNYDEYIQGFEAYFGPVVYVSGDGPFTDGSLATFKYDLYNGTYNNGLYFDISTGSISVDSKKLIENQMYFLTIAYQQEFKGNWFYLSPDTSYYALKFNAADISSGDAISPYLESSVDISMLNALEDYFSYSSGDFENINYSINELLNFSGDLFSGDLFSGDILNKIGYNTYHSRNEYSLTLYDFYRRIIGVLMEDSTSSYIEFEYRGNNYRFYASDFKTPDSAFKFFISRFIIVLFSIGIVKRLAVLFKRMAVLDFVGISSSFDVDDSNFL